MAGRMWSANPASQRHSRLAALFGIDLRSLAAFRIGLGLLLLVDLWGRARTLRVDYTGEGVYPREIAAQMQPDSALVHLFLWSDRVEVQTWLFRAFALLALFLVVGWRTRLVSVLVFWFEASLIRRNHWVCHTGDVWLQVLLFWGMFLPLGAHFSLDRLRASRRPRTQPYALDVATAGVLIQVALFYVMAGYLKSRYEVWTRGDAVWAFTHALEYRRPFGEWLGGFPAVCRLLTYATLVLEGLAPFLLFFPVWLPRLRIALFLVFAAFHLTLQATIHIGIFQIICIVAMTLFLPGTFWDSLARAVPSGMRLAWERLARALGRRVGSAEPGPALEGTRLARPLRIAKATGLTLAMGVILISNLDSAVEDPYDSTDEGVLALPKPVEDYGRMLGLVQNWNMFTDIERLFFGWFTVLGQEEDGRIVDVLENRPFEGFSIPRNYARSFPNHDSRRYWREMARPRREFLQKPLCDYLAREWQSQGNPPLAHLGIFHVGNVPARAELEMLVKPVCVQWEAEHEPLRLAPPEVQARWASLRESWKSFLEGLPEKLPAASR